MYSARERLSSAETTPRNSDRASFLAAINEVALGLNNNKINDRENSKLLSNARVNQRMKKDLMSRASRAADLRDFTETD